MIPGRRPLAATGTVVEERVVKSMVSSTRTRY
jgi:hypothetical protein